MLFEIHITGNEKIIEACKKLDVRTIVIDLLKPDNTVLKSEYMTSQQIKYSSLTDCLEYVEKLEQNLIDSGVEICRVKVESPYTEKYQGLYVESHFKTEDFNFPVSRNRNKKEKLATKRVYEDFEAFVKENDHIEFCLLDTNVFEDKEWFDLYEPKRTETEGRGIYLKV